MRWFWTIIALPVFFIRTALALEVVPPGIPAGQRSFAIVVDRETYQFADREIGDYRHLIESEGLPTFILVDNWADPEAVRDSLKFLHREHALEGVVLLGRIPIPMIRNAQHLTSAFKGDQSGPNWIESSVPSDRFYEDFDLSFNFLKKEGPECELCFYYALSESSPQRIQKEIYSARMLPSSHEIRDVVPFLRKVLEVRSRRRSLSRGLVFTGVAYNSESKEAFEDERKTWKELVPSLFQPAGSLDFIRFDSRDIKRELLSLYGSREYDFAVFHAHGGVKVQYLGKERKDQDVREVNLYSHEVKGLSQKIPFVIFDQCSTGTFHRREFIAGEYLFNGGQTIAAIANSTNTLQDKWIHGDFPLLDSGLSVGEFHKRDAHLESHLFGDPTLRFDAHANETARGILELDESGNSSLLAKRFREEASKTLRMQILKRLARFNDRTFHEILKTSISDEYELVRRKSAMWMGQIGSPEHIPYLMQSFAKDKGERVVFNASDSLFVMSGGGMGRELLKHQRLPRKARKKLSALLRSGEERLEYLISSLNDVSLATGVRVSAVESFRNYRFDAAVQPLLAFLDRRDPDSLLNLTVLEALGWFTMNRNRGDIVDRLQQIRGDLSLPEVARAEAAKSIRRILDGPNVVETP